MKTPLLIVALAALGGTACGDDGGTPGQAIPRCGDLACNGSETCATCASDCGLCNVAYCGNGACDGGEFCGSCGDDCGACPGAACDDGTCSGSETCRNCPGDCGACAAAVCGDAVCVRESESCATCPGDCGECAVLCGVVVCEVGLVCVDARCEEPCVAACDDRVCGDDGCGGSCGTCASGTCVAGQCQATCSPSCEGRVCGEDGCGGSCGTCASGTCVAGQCQATCSPSCEGRVCGEDGCGGSCGTCASGTCVAGQCQATCSPSCEDRVCGDDGCGGSCGTCASGSCVAGVCEGVSACGGIAEVGCCTADHAVKRCLDGEAVSEQCPSAGAACTWGEADEMFGCDLTLQPTPVGVATLCPGEVCRDTCDGKSCGTACGKSCGTCPEGSYCAGNACVDDPCLGVAFTGCCIGNFVLYCESNELRLLDCAPDQPCGWDVANPENGYTCNGVGVDPAGEVSYFCPLLPVAAPTLPVAGELVVSEIMANPAAVDDSVGEWFEVHNRSRRVLALKGLTVEGAAGESFTVTVTIYLPPGEAAIFARRGRVDNGGVQADVQFGSGFGLTNSSDAITLRAAGVLVDGVTYDAAWNVASGVSLSLRSAALLAGENDLPSAWCAARTVSVSGDKGTPRGPNDCE